jgi:hypothetical protein
MTSQFERRPTFESLIGAGADIPEPHRKWLELAKDYRLTAFEGASGEVLNAHDLRVHQAIRRHMDVRAAAMNSGSTVTDILMRQPRGGPPREDVTDPDDFEARQRASEMEHEMDKRDVVARHRRRSQWMGEIAAENLAGADNYTQMHQEALAGSRNRYGPAEGALRGAGARAGEAVGTAFAGSAIGGTLGRVMGGGAGRAAGMATDVAGAGATRAAKSAAWLPFEMLGFEMEDRPRRREL